MVAEAWISKTPSPENKSLYFDVYQSIIEKATLGGKLDARYRREVSRKLLDHCLEYDNPVAFDYYCTNKSMEDFLGISYYKETMEECLQKSIYTCKPGFLDYLAQKGYQLTTDLIEANTHSHLVYVSLTAYSADFDGWIEDQDNEWTPSERDWVLNWVKSIGQFPLLPQLFMDRLELFLEKTPNMANASVLKSILEQHSLDAATPAVTTRVRTPRL
jgi:hypothetical protein